MLLFMHVHFLIITNIHILGIFSKLVSQCASVRMTQFFYILTYNIHVKVYCYCLTLNYYCPTVTVDIELLLSNSCYPTIVVWAITVQRLLSNGCCPTVAVWTVIVQPLLFELLLSKVAVQPLLFEHKSNFLTISRVLELHFKLNWSCWKAKTRGYKFSEEGEPNSSSEIVKIAHQPISPTALQNQSRLSLGW